MKSHKSSLGYMLPKNSLIMAKKGAEKRPLDPVITQSSVKVVFVSEKLETASLQLLQKMIQAMGLSMSQVNIIEFNQPDLLDTIKTLNPEFVIGLGDVVSQSLLQTTAVRGSIQDLGGIKFMPTFDPSFLLQNPSSKKDAWEDLKKVAKEVGTLKN